jgi:hypothetical protein
MALFKHLVPIVGRLEIMIDAEQEMKATVSVYSEATKALLAEE